MTMNQTNQKYILDTCASGFKDLDGKILHMTNDIDKICDDDLLCDEDKSVMVIFDEEDEESCAIQEENQYDLMIYRMI